MNWRLGVKAPRFFSALPDTLIYGKLLHLSAPPYSLIHITGASEIFHRGVEPSASEVFKVLY